MGRGRGQLEDNIGLFDPPRQGCLAAGEPGDGRRFGRGRGLAAEPVPCQGQKLGLVHGAGDGHDHPVRRIQTRAPVADGGAGDRPEAGHGAEDRPPQRLAAEGPSLGHFEDVVVGGVEGLGDLLGHHVLLALDLGRVERGPEDQVGHHLHSQRQGAVQGADLETGALIAGRGVQRAALGLDPFDDLARAHVARALEHQMFQAVGPARGRLGLPFGSAAHGDGQGQGAQAGHGIADDADAVGEGMERGGQEDSSFPIASLAERGCLRVLRSSTM